MQHRGQTVPLKVIHQGKETTIDDSTTALVGSDASSTIRIVRPGISRRHALLQYDGSGWKIEDAGSRNGTFIDGRRVTVQPIADSTTAFLGHPSDGEQITLVPERTPTVLDDLDEAFELTEPPKADPKPAAPAPVVATTRSAAPTRIQQQPTGGSTSDVELAQLTAAIRDQISTLRGLTWSIWAMIAVTAILIVLTLFVGVLAN